MLTNTFMHMLRIWWKKKMKNIWNICGANIISFTQFCDLLAWIKSKIKKSLFFSSLFSKGIKDAHVNHKIYMCFTQFISNWYHKKCDNRFWEAKAKIKIYQWISREYMTFYFVHFNQLLWLSASLDFIHFLVEYLECFQLFSHIALLLSNFLGFFFVCWST